MSYDPNAHDQQSNTPPVGSYEKPPSKKKWWILGSLGCVGVIGLCCIGFLIAGYMAAKPMQDIFRESQEFARTSTVVQEALGEPGETIAVADTQDPVMPASRTEGDISIQEWRFPVSGSKAEGDLIIEIAIKPPMTFERKSLKLELDDGTIIDLDPDEEFSLDIDTGESSDDMGGEEH